MSAVISSLNERQLEARKTFIGGSSAAAALGMSPWQTPLELWLEMTGRKERPDISGKGAVKWGIYLEDPVAQEFSRVTGLKIRRDSTSFVHPEHEFMGGHIDRRIVGRREGLEVKTAGFFAGQEWGEEGTDSVPLHYLIQAVHYMAVTGWDGWHFAVLIGGQDFRTYFVPRDEELIARVIEGERQFWSYIVEDIPPDYTSGADVLLRFPTDDGSAIGAEEEHLAAYHELTGIKAEVKKLEKRGDELTDFLKMRLENHTELLGPDNRPLAVWKASTSRRFDSKAFSKEHPELFEKYSTETTTRRFNLK